MTSSPTLARVRAAVLNPDSVGLLSIFIIALVAVPSRLIFGPLGGAGSLASIIGLGIFLWWIAVRLAVGPGPRIRQPVRIGLLIVWAAVIASYIAASTRPISADELRAADLGLVNFIAWSGPLLAALDYVGSRARLDVLLRRLSYAGGALAALGIMQYITKQPFTNYIQIPGFSANNELVSISSRDGITRPAGTTLHPIEFGAVLTAILPLALHYAVADRHRRAFARWWPVAAIAVAVPISISRSAIVSAVVVLAFILPTWQRTARRVAYVAMVILGGLVYVAVPGLLGTITGLFTGISNDTSAQSRTGSYTLAWEFIERAPVFGRGFPTFLPAYRILDNQYLGILIDMGFVGLAAVLVLFATGVLNPQAIRNRTTNVDDRQLARALAASIAAASLSFALFDAFSFPMVSGLVFLVLGCVGALQRFSYSDNDSEKPAVPASNASV